MAILRQITFTGIGVETDLKVLKEIQDEYPLVEWGVLLSKNWQENGPRFFDPSQLNTLRWQGLNLSCHLCGSAARAIVSENWEPAFEVTRGMFGLFQRCQVNISMEQPNDKTQYMRPPIDLSELIIQQKSAGAMNIFNAIKNRTKMSVLLDASGGRGIDTPVKPLNIPGLKVGYAGGLNPDNVGEKLEYLLENVEGEFWIDMESGVRTDDSFDIDKCVSVLQTCQKIMEG